MTKTYSTYEEAYTSISKMGIKHTQYFIMQNKKGRFFVALLG